MKHTTVLYLIIAGLTIALFFCFRGCHKTQGDGVKYVSNDSLQKWVNALGDTVTALKTTRKELARKNQGFDSLATLYRTKPKFIKEITTVYLEGKEVIVPSGPPVVIRDTIEGIPEVVSMSQAFENNYHIAEVTIHREKDSSKLLLSSLDTIDIVGKEVKEGNIFNRKTFYQIDVKNRNPYVQVVGVTAYRAPVPKQYFELNGKAGYSTKGNGASVFAGGEALIYLSRRWTLAAEGGFQWIDDGYKNYGEGSVKYNIFKF